MFDPQTFSRTLASAEPAGKGEGRGNVEVPHSERPPSSPSAPAQPQEGAGPTSLMTAARIIAYAEHRRKPFCSALIPSGSFTF